MNRYEVTYEQDGQVATTVVEASGPVDAQHKFLAERPAGTVVLCVVRL